MPVWAAFLSGVGSVLAIGALLVRIGGWGSHHDDAISRHDDEIKRLRDWRHRIGDDPCESVLKLYLILEKEIERLNKKVFNGHGKPPC